VTELGRVLAHDLTQREAARQATQEGLGGLRQVLSDVQQYAIALGLHANERVEALGLLAGQYGAQVDRLERAYTGLSATLEATITQSNDQLARYLRTAEEKQDRFFSEYDDAVARISAGLTEAASVLVDAVNERREAAAADA
jgi:hypothetical protein